MLPRAYANEHCSIAATLEIVGDRWTLLILREACQGVRRFTDFEDRLGVARTVLSDRLARLVDEGIMKRRRYQERPERFEYCLTAKGRDLWPVLSALRTWGDRHLMGGNPPLLVRHRDCGGLITDRRVCADCGAPVEVDDVERDLAS
ncbi:helix-turn-helix transcriptional regulator [Planosporangium flavigriseum]|uniref:HxlR family transcriptional regulator n=1 Tax=Planosporangium flavigriseum TaxID=373681 RepID=A0A8J3PPJ2_9ACTN|nr:helix-turn-helix domain-containing protein [Planosporangium flavigriseum]NJC66193.1 helix-turn-helix transcriptional regulator [Planosporangium flavigriseum]GIG76429.1 HxlR family transcriptional regulator [Planosporangium flavigriseum]